MAAKDNNGRSRLTFYERGPGPAGYILPTLIGKPKHAVTHRIQPEYGFGLKLPTSFLTKSIGPGPAGYGIEQGVKAKGTFTGYKFTMRPYNPPRMRSFSPGPAAYFPGSIDCNRNKAPVYTMRIRHPLLTRAQTPGPNAYDLSPLIGPVVQTKLAAAECTMKGGDRGSKDLVLSPGPVYDIGKPELVKNKSPGFTMRIKWAEISGQKFEAGPCSYDIDKAKIYAARPAWKFGIRHNDFTGIFKTKCDRSRFEPLD